MVRLDLWRKGTTRFERKFLIPNTLSIDAEILIKSHPALFREIYPERFVNNIYLDDHNLNHLSDAVDGTTDRLKVRIRWYGDLFGKVSTPQLELKFKRGTVGRKATFILNDFDLEPGAITESFLRAWNEFQLPTVTKPYLERLRPILLIRYQRRYFLSADHKFRLTLDKDLTTYALSGRTGSRPIQPSIQILELKYAEEHEVTADQVTTHFPIRLTKNSKYVEAVNGLIL